MFTRLPIAGAMYPITAFVSVVINELTDNFHYDTTPKYMGLPYIRYIVMYIVMCHVKDRVFNSF